MSNTDQMSDSAELRALRASLSAIAMPERPGLEMITARGRAHRRRRLSGVVRLTVAGVATGAALALGLTGALSPAPTLGTIRTASFTLTRTHSGTDTLTINPKELLDSAALQSDLAKYGVPARVTVGSFCSSDPAPAGFSQVVSTQPAGEYTAQAGSGQQATISFDPKAMPTGTELSFGDFQLPTGEQQANLALIATSSYTCTSTAPSLGSDTGADSLGLLYGGPGGS